MSQYSEQIAIARKVYREIGDIHGVDVWGALREGMLEAHYTDLYSGHRSHILNSMVVSDASGYSPLIQKAVDQVNAVLRGVDEKYFPSIRFSKAEVDGDKTILYYVAEGKGFSVGVILGSNGSMVGLMLVTDNKQQIGPFSIFNADSVRRAIDLLGIKLSKGEF